MYQTIVLGLGFLLLIGGGYLIKHMDSAGVLTSTVTHPINVTVATSSTSSSTEKVEGIYLCNADSGCPNPSILTISADGTATMATTYGDGVETLRESGTWKSTKDEGVNILLTSTDAGIYPIAHILSIKYVSAFSLSGITFNPNDYKDWTRPVFRKQDNENE